MPKVFVSYRINDSVHATAAIADRLARRLGPENVFRDRDSLPLGALYPRRIRRAVEQCDTVVAVIGPLWLDIRGAAGGRLLDDPRDWVRSELRTAFDRSTPVVPVLLDGTPLPDQGSLPADLALLGLCTYWEVRHKSFEADVRGLLDRLVGPAAEPEPAAGRFVQHNTATGGGRLIANQGDQVIHWTDGDRGAR